jgi:hypothetical protein
MQSGTPILATNIARTSVAMELPVALEGIVRRPMITPRETYTNVKLKQPLETSETIRRESGTATRCL